VVITEVNLLTGVPLDSPESTLTLYTDASITGWGAFLEGRTVSRVWEDCHLEEHKSSGNEGSSIVIETLPRSYSKTVSVDSHRQYDSGGLSSESRGTHSFSLYLLCREIMLLCDSLQTVLTVRHVPGNHNLIANALSRFRVPVNTEWESHPAIFLQAITLI
jgi:hypothetical protein